LPGSLFACRAHGNVTVLGTLALRLFAVGARQPARGPVRLRGVAAARTVEGGDVLERDEDVAVELDVRDPFDPAVRGERSVLVLPAEELHFDLLPFVLVGVVLHRSERSGFRSTIPFVPAVVAAKYAARVVPV
jgi:hypothetical protein